MSAARTDAETVEDLLAELEVLEATVEDDETRERVREVLLLAGAVQPDAFGNVIVGFDRADATEAFLGAVLLGVPLFVESGTLEVGAFVATHPLSLLATHAAAVALVVGILYVADFQDVRVYRPLFGVVPRRLAGVVAIAFVTALAVMTVWGRVDWARPWLALCQCSVAFVPMAIGAALGDILPGS